MSLDHSQEPWKVEQLDGDTLVLVDAFGHQTMVTADLQHDPSVGILGDPDGARTDMRRVAACVNACAGITTEFMEQLVSGGGSINKEVQRLISKRGLLLDICKEFVHRVEIGEVRSVLTYAKMKEAIACIEGKDRRLT